MIGCRPAWHWPYGCCLYGQLVAAMANARNERVKKNAVSVRGPWLAMPLDFLRSRAWAELSPQAAKMLLDLCAGLGPNARGNGDLSAAPVVMKPKGWRSTANRVAALQELEGARLIVTMRRGHRRQCALYAVTLWPLQCDTSKLDSGPGCYTTTDWMNVGGDRATCPTSETPARWKTLRKIDIGLPATGQPPADMYPLRDNPTRLSQVFVPATGKQRHVLTAEVVPLRDTYLDLPSVGAGAGAALSPSLLAALKRTACIHDGAGALDCASHSAKAAV